MKRFFTLSIFTILFGGYAMAYDFEAVCETGQTLYYNITSSHNTFPTRPDNVEVTYPLHYSNNDEYYSGYDKPTGELIIPSSVTYNGVTYSVTRIGESAFRYCYNLSSVVIPNSVTEIRSNAFHWCGLRSVTIPNSVTNIGDCAFYCCGLTGELTIPSSVTNIGECAFNQCGGLTSITIGERVANIGRLAFLNSSDTIIINFNAIDCTCGSQVFGNIYTFITLNIGDRVENIPGGAFRECNFLESPTIPNSVKCIGGYAFEKCRGLTSVTIPNSVTSIGSYAFNHCNDLTEITIGNSVTNIGDNAFADCWELTTVNFNATNCTTMGSVVMNSGSSNNSVFKNALALTTLNIGNNVTNIPDYAFYGCSKLAGRLDIPNSVTNIGQGAFCGCIGLAGRLDIPNSVISIGNYAFSGCSGFSSITIGERVNSIGNSAIYCIGVDTIYSNAINPPILGSFNCVNESIPVIVPCGCIPAYNNDYRWCLFANIQQSPDCAGVEENEFASIEMYPNPVSNTLYINNEETISEIEIENTLGQVVKRIEVNADNAVCNVEDLKAGLYIVRIYGTNTESVVCQRKFIKE